MRTAREALFSAMVNDGWACESTGDIEAPTGYFAWMTNAPDELDEIREAFEDIIQVYGDVADEDLIGAFLVTGDDHGRVFVERFDSEMALRAEYARLEDIYAGWSDD